MRISSKHKENPTNFTRDRKIGFRGVLVSVLINLKRSLTVEIDNFIDKLDVDDDLEYTKQAYSKARQNLKPSAYIELNNIALEETYIDEFKTFKGYRVIAVDGSTVQLPNTVEMREKYGVFCEKDMNYPAARVCLAYDVLNEVILDGKLIPYNKDEQSAAIELIPALYKSKAEDILLFDRGYPSVRLITLLNSLNKKYVLRVSKSFLKEVNKFTKGTDDDKTINVDIDKRRIAVNRIKDISEPVNFDLRCVRIKLKTEDEILITNLTPEEMNLDELNSLYKKRWGIETNYNLVKNALELENFTGDTERVILQDFYATIYICNVASIIIADAQEEYESTLGDKKKKHSYKVNKRIAIAYVKRDLLHVMLQDDPEKAVKLYEKFVKKLSKQVIPIRSNRSNARPTRHMPKYGRTNKRVL